jgi:hypothetical protein
MAASNGLTFPREETGMTEETLLSGLAGKNAPRGPILSRPATTRDNVTKKGTRP